MTGTGATTTTEDIAAIVVTTDTTETKTAASAATVTTDINHNCPHTEQPASLLECRRQAVRIYL
jgi:hypothetical protein